MAASSAPTKILNVARVVALLGVVIVKCVAALLTTAIGLDPPVSAAVAVSVAVIVSLAMDFRVTGKIPVPLAKGELGGRAAWASLLENCTVPE